MENEGKGGGGGGIELFMTAASASQMDSLRGADQVI